MSVISVVLFFKIKDAHIYELHLCADDAYHTVAHIHCTGVDAKYDFFYLILRLNHYLKSLCLPTL